MVVTVEYLGGWCSVSRGERLLYYIMDNDNMDDNMDDNIIYICIGTIRNMDDNMDDNIAIWTITWTIT